MKIGKLDVVSKEGEPQTVLLKSLSVFEGGRSRGNHILIDDPSVAMNHFRVCRNGEGYSIYDLGSASGTQVNGDVVERSELEPGDVITAGDVTIHFELVEDGAEGQLASISSTTRQAGAPIEVASHGKTSCLRVIEGDEKGRAFRLIGKSKFTIGRSSQADLRLKDGKVSRIHAIVERVGDHFIIVDQESANGTMVNGDSVRKTVLKEGDYIRLGFSIIKFGIVEDR